MKTVRLPVIKKSTLRKSVADYMSRKSNKQQLYIVLGCLSVLALCSVLSILSSFIR